MLHLGPDGNSGQNSARPNFLENSQVSSGKPLMSFHQNTSPLLARLLPIVSPVFFIKRSTEDHEWREGVRGEMRRGLYCGPEEQPPNTQLNAHINRRRNTAFTSARWQFKGNLSPQVYTVDTGREYYLSHTPVRRGWRGQGTVWVNKEETDMLLWSYLSALTHRSLSPRTEEAFLCISTHETKLSRLQWYQGLVYDFLTTIVYHYIIIITFPVAMVPSVWPINNNTA